MVESFRDRQWTREMAKGKAPSLSEVVNIKFFTIGILWGGGLLLDDKRGSRKGIFPYMDDEGMHFPPT